MGIGPLSRAVIATSGRAVLLRAVPMTSAVAIAAAIVFSKNGLRARDLVEIIHTSLGARIALWAGWTMLAAPALAPAFDAPGTRTLRSLRPSRALFAMLGALAILVSAPWVLLFARGEGAVSAACVALFSVALTSSASVASRSRRGAMIFAGVAVLALIDVRSPVVLVPAALASWLGLRTAWRDAFEHRPAWRIVRRAPAVLALASTHLACLARGAMARLQAAGFFWLAGGAALALTLRNDPDATPLRRALVVLAFPATLAAALLAAPVVETEKRLLPLLRSTRTRALTLALAASLALAAPSTAFAATAGTIAAISAHAPSSIALASSLWAFVIACVVAAWARRAARARRSSTFLVGVIVIATAFTTVAAC